MLIDVWTNIANRRRRIPKIASAIYDVEAGTLAVTFDRDMDRTRSTAKVRLVTPDGISDWTDATWANARTLNFATGTPSEDAAPDAKYIVLLTGDLRTVGGWWRLPIRAQTGSVSIVEDEDIMVIDEMANGGDEGDEQEQTGDVWDEQGS